MHNILFDILMRHDKREDVNLPVVKKVKSNNHIAIYLRFDEVDKAIAAFKEEINVGEKLYRKASKIEEKNRRRGYREALNDLAKYGAISLPSKKK